MKVLIYAKILLTGPTRQNGKEIKTDEMIWLDCSLPALPRTGDVMELTGCQDFIGSTTVESVAWFPHTDKSNVFFPVIYLEEDDYFDKHHRFAPGTTIEEKIELLKKLVMETHDDESSYLKFDCNK